jgi:hypothetical protein
VSFRRLAADDSSMTAPAPRAALPWLHAITRRRLAAALVAGALAGGLVACTPFNSPKTAAVAASRSATPKKPTPPPPPPAFWPLTGVVSGPVPARPAIAVKIENSIDARPQTGLSSADMVWEEVVEGGITRYVAVFHSHLPPEIGPVRSVRPMDPSIAAPLHGLLAFSGGLYAAQVKAAGLQVVSMDAGDDGFYRVKRRYAPHNVYASLRTFLGQADAAHRAAPPAQFLFAGKGQQPTAFTAGQPTASLKLTLSGIGHPQWAWSQPTGTWLRSERTTPAVEAGGKQLGAANVVVLRVNVVNTSSRDPAGNPVPETQLTGSGPAVVATWGHTVAATWTKASVDGVLALTGPDGLPVRLAPGNTWVELVPNGTGAVVTG